MTILVILEQQFYYNCKLYNEQNNEFGKIEILPFSDLVYDSIVNQPVGSGVTQGGVCGHVYFMIVTVAHQVKLFVCHQRVIVDLINVGRYCACQRNFLNVVDFIVTDTLKRTFYNQNYHCHSCY